MGPLTKNLNLSGGQVAATATEISAGSSDQGRRINVTFANTGAQTETLVLTLAVNGGTARRLFRCTLDENEQLVVGGLPLDRRDSLRAATTNALAVDYVVSIAALDSLLTFQKYDEDGQPVRGGLSIGEALALIQDS